MSAVAILEIVQVLNGLMALGVNGLVSAQKVGAVLEKSIAEDRPITEEEWAEMLADADVADARLAATLERIKAEKGQG